MANKLPLRVITTLGGSLAVHQNAKRATSPRRGEFIETESWTRGCQGLGAGGDEGDHCPVWDCSLFGVMRIVYSQMAVMVQL